MLADLILQAFLASVLFSFSTLCFPFLMFFLLILPVLLSASTPRSLNNRKENKKKKTRKTNLLLPNNNLHLPPPRHDLRQIAQPHLLRTALVDLHAQRLQYLRIEPSARAEFGQVVFQPFDRCGDFGFQGREIRGVFIAGARQGGGLGGALFFASGFGAFFKEGGRCGECSVGVCGSRTGRCDCLESC